MSDSYYNIRASDRAELEEIVKDISFKNLKREIHEAVGIAVHELDMDELDEIEIANNIIANMDWEFPTKEFVDAIGMMGWRIFSRTVLKKLKNRFRMPRVKKLIGEK